MKNNKGMSYIELILVISIALILTGIGTFSFGMIRRTSISKAADRTISKVNEARNASLVKGTNKGVLAFYNKNGSLYCYIGEDFTSVDMNSQTWEKICSKPVTLKVTTVDGSTSELGDGGFVKTKFKQSTGEVESGIIRYTFQTSKSSVVVKVYKATGKPVLD